MAYQALKERIAKSLPNRFILSRREDYRYLSFLRQDFPRKDIFLTRPDLVIVGRTCPTIEQSKYRFIQYLELNGDYLADLILIDRASPVLFLGDPSRIGEILERGFRVLELTIPGRIKILSERGGAISESIPLQEEYSLPLSEVIAEEPFRKTLEGRPEGSYREIIESYLHRDLASMTLEYLTAREIPFLQWRIGGIRKNERGRSEQRGGSEATPSEQRGGSEATPSEQRGGSERSEHERSESEATPSEQRGGSQMISSPSRIAVSANGREICILETVQGQNRSPNTIQLFSLDELLDLGEDSPFSQWEGHPNYYFSDLAMSPKEDKIYAIDAFDHHISIFSWEGKVLQIWTGYDMTGINYTSPSRIRFGTTGGRETEGSTFIYILDVLPAKLIRVYDSQAQLIRTWSIPHDFDCNDFAIHKDEIFILGFQGILIYSILGHFIGKIGIPKRPQFDRFQISSLPTGIAISPEGEIYIVDSRRHYVTVLDIDGRYLRTFGYKGDKEGEFNAPQGIAISPQGEICITDGGNYRVQVFRKRY
jgi:DNA-binding beta-propeller fold protein YncE